MTDERQTRLVTGYLSLYLVNRCYGGPEEGGWYYDAYVWTKVSFPFRAKQDFMFFEADEDEGTDAHWGPIGIPEPEDHQAMVRLTSMQSYLTELFGVEETRTRFSVLGGDDHHFIMELEPGKLEERERPRYG